MPESSATYTRRGRLLRRGASFLVLLAVAGYLAVQYVTGGTGDKDCEVVSAGGDGATYAFTPEQAVNAATITAVGTSRGLPERAVAIALATAIQESGLRNITHGDRDSLGLFQQRPSQGWGTKKEILDPTYSAGEFYDRLVKISDYTRLPLTVAAQRVQRSGYPEAYAKHEPDAVLLAAALTGRAAATLTCEGRPADTPAGGPDAVRAALVRDFGRDALAVAGAEVRRSTTATPSPSPTATTDTASRTVTVPVPPGTGKAAGTTVLRRGWQLAQWAVANASALHIQNVTYAGRRWTAGNTDSQWRPVGTGKGTGDGTDVVRIVTMQ
ncbi:heavy metal transporter [Streptomyces sp. ME02-8801-2C]|uniref:heavy metal transporter n=1 Tax=Streptomyces sp. ME02-8801-2C TaxID=3028680 RepID=UPI0029AEF772|nr:heavy metal transporter [Streptomyces sp. ME02-8801-2C]MDX3456577.1 heavy metal transporter [Streptomyces sp. ME02-8801-2C]